MKKYITILAFMLFESGRTCALASEASGPDMSSAVIRMISGLAVILGLMLVALYLMKRFWLQKRSILGSRRSLELLETLYLGPKKSIALVRAGRDVLLIGLSPAQISFLSKVAIPEKKGPAGRDDFSFEELLSEKEKNTATGETLLNKNQYVIEEEKASGGLPEWIRTACAGIYKACGIRRAPNRRTI